MLFLVSVALMAWSSLRWSSRLAESEGDGFWIFIAAVMLQVGAIASLTSLVHQLTPAAWLLLQLLACALAAACTGGLRRPRLAAAGERLRAGPAAFAAGLTPWGAVALLALCGMLAASFAMQAATPIHGFDEKMYHASRVIYWIQHRSVLPFETHNLRQTMLPFGSELFFLWPVLFTKSEPVGRMVFWLAFPAAAAGVYFLLRTLRAGQTAAIAGALVLVSTPLIATTAIRLKPELWWIVALLGAAHWAASICGKPEARQRDFVFLGIFVVLAIDVRPFAIALLPGVLLVGLWAPGALPVATRMKSLAAGLAGAALASTLLIPLAFNTALYGHPMGPQEARSMVRAELTPRTLYTHAVRFAFLMLELPDVPASAQARSVVSGAANRLISGIGAGQPLRGEDQLPWLGRYVYELPEHSTRFSLWGLLWIPAIAVAAVLLLRNIATTWPRVRLTAASAQSLLALPLLGAVLFGSRWMTQSEVPARFLVGPFALLLPVGIALLAPALAARKFGPALAAVALAYGAYHPLRAQAYDAIEAMVAPMTAKEANDPFDEIVGSVVPSGSRILFVGDQDAQDYPLFSPATRYANTVIPWGARPFDAARMRRMIASEKVTHVLVLDEDRLEFGWFPAVETRKMVAWLAAENGLAAVPVKAPRMRLFAVSDGNALNEGALATTGIPAPAPLVTVDAPLAGQVGLDPAFLETPWAVEDLGAPEGGFLWMGQGHAEGIEFGVWSRQDREVEIRLDVSPGPSLAAPQRNVILQVDGVPVGTEHRFDAAASLVLRARLHRGRNLVSFFGVDTATLKKLPNGDTRRLVVALHAIRIGAAQAAAATPPAAQRSDLAQAARKAVGLVASRQQADGYWLTTYTGSERYENPRVEMNTFVTSTMVDLLGEHVPAGLAGSVQRARAHLRDQIEDTGLVRYHGRPDAAAMTTHGLCPITPDADDTALVWRIAPGDPPLRAGALATLAQYRTAEGLYHSWLAKRSDYRCIDPGKDPNPTDVAINMHVLLFLAQADPPAARALCGALRQAIDQDRIWVYYRQAPLVPVLRQPRVQAAGCDLRLPAARAETHIEAQATWLAAGHMLQRLHGPATGFPTGADIARVLRELAADDFAPVRREPPLLYHNDQTASVRRFYWAEDVGYAIWLKLYLDGVRLGLLPPDPDALAGDSAIVRKTP